MEKIEETFELEFIDIQEMREIKGGNAGCLWDNHGTGGCLWKNQPGKEDDEVDGIG